jgi:hypothetical protein
MHFGSENRPFDIKAELRSYEEKGNKRTSEASVSNVKMFATSEVMRVRSGNLPFLNFLEFWLSVGVQTVQIHLARRLT